MRSRRPKTISAGKECRQPADFRWALARGSESPNLSEHFKTPPLDPNVLSLAKLLRVPDQRSVARPGAVKDLMI
jgi:hypothetical protein